MTMLVCSGLRFASDSLATPLKARYYSYNTLDATLVITKKHKKVTLIGLNRPEKKNAVNIQLLNELETALTKFENDASSYVGVLYGEGGNFCSGYDLEQLASEEQSKILLSSSLIKRYVKKPLVAALSGYGVGFGFELALWCDFRLMEDTALIGFYGRRFGIPVSKWSLRRLQCAVGITRSMDLLLTGRGIQALEAHKYGLLVDTTQCGTVLGQALSLANCIAKFPQASLLADRAQVHELTFNPHESELGSIHEEYVKNSELAYRILTKGKQIYSISSEWCWKEMTMSSTKLGANMGF
ncbi:unnamed protein product [Bemisia tabaci]|uniref:Enoyl-CoA hydratase n=1 Tax=Bemisia tabaci TaxID=7038 RepID=A0A9N9ZXA7_BEMTA|nr:unnamed protein product [Bemisia tabaci]